MADITRYDPFTDIDELFKGFFLKPVMFEGESKAQIKMDVTENDKEYTVHAEIPGAKKEDIKVTIDGNQVSISAEMKKEKEEKGEKMIRRERYYGNVYRSFSLASDIDEAAAQAKYADGVLELKLPKKAGAAAKQIEIK